METHTLSSECHWREETGYFHVHFSFCFHSSLWSVLLGWIANETSTVSCHTPTTLYLHLECLLCRPGFLLGSGDKVWTARLPSHGMHVLLVGLLSQGLVHDDISTHHLRTRCWLVSIGAHCSKTLQGTPATSLVAIHSLMKETPWETKREILSLNHLPTSTYYELVAFLYITLSQFKRWRPKLRSEVIWPATMSRTCNPGTLGGWGRWITWGWEFETSLANMVKPRLY